jgi:hypothetical protein
MGKVIQFRRKKETSREQALNWLVQNGITDFPYVDVSSPVGPDVFHGWRFVLAYDTVVYFANCIDPGISELEVATVIEGASPI